MKTVAVYVDSDNGRFRAGTVTVKGSSAREISAQIRAKMPNLDTSKTFFCRRFNLMGKMVDDNTNLIKLEPPEQSDMSA